jgi:iron complex transport system permease protein
VADTLSRSVAQPNELPIGLITSLLGAPVLIALVTVKNNVWKTQ